jgi:mitochondrial enoyl-[acyl-carrier protein] reductase / trans-2-enoyl-CoA reductase
MHRCLGLKHRPISSIHNLSYCAIVFASTGHPYNVISLHSHSLLDEPAPNSVLVKFLAAPINTADPKQIEGVYASKAKFQSLPGEDSDWAVGGNEGVVKFLKVGDQVKEEGIKPGQSAIMKSTAFGTQATRVALLIGV